jgi:Tol biopolymer transport system component
MVMTLDGREPVAFAASAAAERSGKLSPDGRWLAYVSDVSGAFEIYVQSFPATAAKWQVSSSGGTQPQWNANGRELFYVARDRRLMVAAVSPESSTFAFAPPRPLMNTRISSWDSSGIGLRYAVNSDGQQFLLSTDTETIRPVTLVRNWMAAARN